MPKKEVDHKLGNFNKFNNREQVLTTTLVFVVVPISSCLLKLLYTPHRCLVIFGDHLGSDSVPTSFCAKSKPSRLLAPAFLLGVSHQLVHLHLFELLCIPCEYLVMFGDRLRTSSVAGFCAARLPLAHFVSVFRDPADFLHSFPLVRHPKISGFFIAICEDTSTSEIH